MSGEKTHVLYGTPGLLIMVPNAKFAGPLHESRLYRGDDIPGIVALHMTTVSR